ncbi:uncharacterized protein LOC141902649 isoform X2 [Tubulanus polymorphus]|uniref:uncharacterized protein LOC141902649 isoform X2 n=1 Tax=Tubulanus polymorphus TaxID=672921 RepID=UPI003DA69A5E
MQIIYLIVIFFSNMDDQNQMWARVVWLENNNGTEKEFEDTVPHSWIEKEKDVLRWPPGIDASKYLNKMVVPGNNWRDFKLVKIKHVSECDKCEETDVTTDHCKKTLSGRHSKKRKRHEYLYESESDQDSEIDSLMGYKPLPLVPPVPPMNRFVSSPRDQLQSTDMKRHTATYSEMRPSQESVNEYILSPRPVSVNQDILSPRPVSLNRTFDHFSEQSQSRDIPLFKRHTATYSEMRPSQESVNEYILSPRPVSLNRTFDHLSDQSQSRDIPLFKRHAATYSEMRPSQYKKDRKSTSSTLDRSFSQQSDQSIELAVNVGQLAGESMDDVSSKTTQIFPIPEGKFQKKVFFLLAEIRSSLQRFERERNTEEYKVEQVKGMNEFNELEEFIQNPENRKLLVLRLEKIGGETVANSVLKTMQRVMTNDVMSKFNMKGNRGKRAFEKTNMCLAITESVMKLFSTATEGMVLKSIGTTLKYAPDRKGGPGRKVNNMEEIEANSLDKGFVFIFKM